MAGPSTQSVPRYLTSNEVQSKLIAELLHNFGAGIAVNDSESAASSNPYRAPLHSSAVTASEDSFLGEGIGTTLRQTRPWVMLLGILGFLLAGLMLLGGVGITIFTMIAGGGGGAAPRIASAVAVGVTYAFIALFYIPPSLYLVRYANRIKEFLTAPSAAGLQSALSAQKSFWKFVGIAMLVIMLFYGVVLVIGVIIGVLSLA